jgi:hypothetical protein
MRVTAYSTANILRTIGRIGFVLLDVGRRPGRRPTYALPIAAHLVTAAAGTRTSAP